MRDFWVVVVVEERGGHGSLLTVVDYAIRGGPGKNTPNKGGLPKSKITIAPPPLYINYEPSRILHGL